MVTDVVYFGFPQATNWSITPLLTALFVALVFAVVDVFFSKRGVFDK